MRLSLEPKTPRTQPQTLVCVRQEGAFFCPYLDSPLPVGDAEENAPEGEIKSVRCYGLPTD